MATPRNQRKFAGRNKENCQKNPRSNLAQNSSLPGSKADYLTLVCDEIEGRVRKKLSQEFCGT